MMGEEKKEKKRKKERDKKKEKKKERKNVRYGNSRANTFDAFDTLKPTHMKLGIS